jgi:hypothetical protein
MFLVAGATPKSGKTTFLHTWIIGVAESFSPERVKFIFLDAHSRTMMPFRDLPHTVDYVSSKLGFETAINNLLSEINKRAKKVEEEDAANSDGFDIRAYLATIPHVAIVMDDYHIFASRGESERQQLGNCLQQGERLGISLIVAGNASELPRDYQDPMLIQRIRRQGCGVLLGGSAGIDEFNNARLPSYQMASNLPIGRGYLIKRGQVRLFQSAVCWQDSETPDKALAQRIARVKQLHARSSVTRTA